MLSTGKNSRWENRLKDLFKTKSTKESEIIEDCASKARIVRPLSMVFNEAERKLKRGLEKDEIKIIYESYKESEEKLKLKLEEKWSCKK